MPALFVISLTTRDSDTFKRPISRRRHHRQDGCPLVLPAVPAALPSPSPRHDDDAFVACVAAIDALVASTRHRDHAGWSHDSRERVVQCACGARLWPVLLQAAAIGPLREACT
jgi:hypothetical protein